MRDTVKAASIFENIPGIKRLETNARPLVIPEIAEDGNAFWVDEGTAIGDTGVRFKLNQMFPKKVAAIIPMTSEIVNDSDPAIETIARVKLMEAMANAIDIGFMYGAGTDYEPMGLMNYFGLGVGTGVNMGVNGGSATFDTLHRMLAQIENENHSLDSLRWIMNGRTARDLNMIKDADGYYINAESMKLSPVNTPFLGVPSIQTTKIRRNETQGSSTNATSIVLGDFQNMWIATWAGLEVAVTDQLGWRSDMIHIRAIQRLNCHFEKLNSYSITRGVTSPQLV